MSQNMFRGDLKKYKGKFGVIGIDRTTGQKGIVVREFDIKEIKEPVKEYMETTGLTKKLPFWTGKRIALAFIIGWGIGILVAIALILYVYNGIQ